MRGKKTSVEILQLRLSIILKNCSIDLASYSEIFVIKNKQNQ